MKRYVVVAIILVVLLIIYVFSCARRERGPEESQRPLTMEELTAINVPKETTKIDKPQVGPLSAAKLESLPPGPPYSPGALEIQRALENAGFYKSKIDGKIGPITKKAIREFQKANALKVDGKVGPKTWKILSRYLDPEAQAR